MSRIDLSFNYGILHKSAAEDTKETNQIGHRFSQIHTDYFFIVIDAHYIKARYKEDRFNTKIYNRKSAAILLKDTEDVIRWFTKKLKLKI